MLKYISARFRIAFGLICMLASILLLAIVLGIVPDRRAAVLAGRADLCEAVAVNSSILVNRSEIRRLEVVLRTIVARNDDLLSAAVRRSDGWLAVEVGDHVKLWEEIADERSIESHIQVGIFTNTSKWGRVEFCFKPTTAGGIRGLLTNPWVQLVVFVCALGMLLFYYYLGKMLQHLDPSKAVPGRVRSALDTLAEGLLVTDKQGRIVLANEAFAKGLGRKNHELLGVDARSLAWTNADGSPAVRPYPWETAIETETAQVGISMGLANSAGKRKIFIVNCNPVMGAEGQYRGVLTSFDDITGLEETKAELAESKVAAESANRAKSEFLARMSHEIRTPMNAILGFTDVLRRGIDVDEEDRLDYLSTIHTSGQHLLSLINDILDLSKVEAGKLELELKPCSPLEIVAEVVNVMRARADEKGIQLHYQSDGPIPAAIQSDPTRLRQIFTNLVGNAIKFTEQGEVSVTVRMTGDSDNPRLVVAVKDTGIGMPKGALAKIFDPFAQADESVTRKFGGTGLGLSICKRFTEALGGELTVASELGKGSVFTASVATGSLEGVESITADQLRSTMQPEPTQFRKLQLPPARILVADDAEANRKLMQLVLTRAGVTVDLAENGKVAVEMAATSRYDIVLMDMRMPVMDGAVATQRLREAGFTRPIIALTADAMKGSEENCRAIGCSGFLTKPVDMDLLISTLSKELPQGNDSSQPKDQRQEVDNMPRESTGELAEESQKVTDSTAEVPLDDPTASTVSSKSELPSMTDDNPEQTALHAVQNLTDDMRKSVGRSQSPTTAASTRDRQSAEPATPASPAAASGSPIHSTLPTEDPELCSIVLNWIGRLNSQLAEIHAAAKANDYQELAALAHWLKGSAGTVGFGDFTAPAKSLQLAAEEKNQEQIVDLLKVLDDLAARLAVPEARSCAVSSTTQEESLPG